MSRLTLEELIERKRQSDDDKVKYKAVHSDLLGGEIMVKKLPLRQVTALIDRYPNPNTTESMEMAQELIYRSCDLFRNADLQKEYGIEGNKYEIVSAVFDDNLEELTKVSEEILDFYFTNGMPSIVELKNS